MEYVRDCKYCIFFLSCGIIKKLENHWGRTCTQYQEDTDDYDI